MVIDYIETGKRRRKTQLKIKLGKAEKNLGQGKRANPWAAEARRLQSVQLQLVNCRLMAFLFEKEELAERAMASSSYASPRLLEGR